MIGSPFRAIRQAPRPHAASAATSAARAPRRGVVFVGPVSAYLDAARVLRWSASGRARAADATGRSSGETAAVEPRAGDGTVRPGDGRGTTTEVAPSRCRAVAFALVRGVTAARGFERTGRLAAPDCGPELTSMPPRASFAELGVEPYGAYAVGSPSAAATDTGEGVAGGMPAGLSGTAEVGGEGSGADCGAGGASGVEGGREARRGGRRVSGST